MGLRIPPTNQQQPAGGLRDLTDDQLIERYKQLMTAQKQINRSEFQKDAEEIATSFAIGAVDGVSLGLSGEIAGAVGTAKDVLAGDVPLVGVTPVTCQYLK